MSCVCGYDHLCKRSQSSRTSSAKTSKMPVPFKEEVRIIEQPGSGFVRFRYRDDSIFFTRIPGASSTHTIRTHPKIRLVDYVGPAIARISCVSMEAPHRPHPFEIIGSNCVNGVFFGKFRSDMTLVLSDIGIRKLHVREFAYSLTRREVDQVDPFNTGFGHKNHPRSIDVRGVRLAIQVFLQNSEGQCVKTMEPIVTEPIRDRTYMIEPPQ